jgi:D-alanyl-lipoteichoic acid acyltransferase DltB (MBOAT superfamily)
MFFPQLVAGPIERPQNILHQFYEKHQFSYANLSQGLRMMIWGFFKKVVIADNLGQIIDPVFSAPHTLSAGWLALGSALFAIQIYCDFSGYSDIAIGSAKTMGYTLMENFRFPYISKSIREFWSRWHISLSTWFRDYVYIPLGGNRVSETRKSVNLASVFALSGFWHGANWTFIIWGALHGIYLVIESFLKKTFPSVGSHSIFKIFAPVLIFVLVTVGWIFFRANSVYDANAVIYRIFTKADQIGNLPDALKNIHETYLYFLLALTAFFMATDVYMSKLSRNELPIPFKNANMIFNAIVIAMIAIFGFWGKVQFIYFQF